ncbi:hypothetical protein BFJ69_g17320 [Fusarium oxysporum]|uniref:Uncharacterized protein n=1 Tax=Fusarium oxysporum TaxID=5507 RepID=A0A420M8M5_FUSOX|nr:hypothetical protein BFJ69_g17320 [Fusarium oxysporum]
MHVYPFPQADEWENQWFFFDIQLHPYQLHFRRRVEDGEESIIGGWEDSYAKLAQVRGQMCVQAISIRPLRLANDCHPTIAPRATFHGPVDTTAFRFKAGSLSNNQLKCCGFIQCSTYLVPPRDKDPTFRGGQMFHILAYMPHDQQPWKSRVDWMKGLPEGGFASGKWINGDFTESEPMRQDTFAPPAEREGQLMKLPPEGTTYSSFHEMRQELVEFARSQSYGIRICRSFQKFSRITGDPVAKKRMVWQCNRGGKGDCPFSFNAVEVKIGSDRWEIRYKKNESQHVHNHGPSGGFVICPERKVRK